MATSILSPSANSILLNQWASVYSSAPVSGFTGDVRVVVEVGNGNVRVINTSGITAATGYGSLTNGTATSIAFEGSLANVNAALQSLQAIGTNANANVSLNISAVKAGSAYNPDNGHYYQFVSSPGITWTAAKSAAENLQFNGLPGYLVTIMSAEENAFIVPKLAGEGWIGASDANQEGTFQWYTGPIPYSTIGVGTSGSFNTYINGSSRYNNFASGEPNDYNNGNPGEDYVHMRADGTWNDYPNYEANIKGYIVEYGGYANDNPTEAVATTTKTLTVNAYPVITSNGGGGSASISYAENGTGAVTTVTASDQDSDASLTYSIYGTDAGLFNINASNGQLTFKTSPNYEDPKDSGSDNGYSVVVQVTDNTGLFRSQALLVTVTNVNDAPVVSGGLPASIAATEDISANVNLSALTITDQDTADTVTLKLAATAGTLTAAAAAGITVAGSGSAGITLTGTAAAVTAYLDTTTNIQYTGAANANGSPAASIAVSYKDSAMGGFTAYGSTAVNIAAVNDAPMVVSPSTAVALAGINEDQGHGSATGTNPGASVSSLFGARFSDVDTGNTMSGIVVVGNVVDTAKGQWQYSTVANEWHDIGTVSNGAGLVLSSTTKLRFAPADNWFSTPPTITPGELSVKLLDNTQASFTAGATKVTLDSATGTAVSLQSVNLGTTVASVNDLPTITSTVIAAGLTETAGPDTSVTTATGALTGTLTVFDVEGVASVGIRGGSTSTVDAITTVTKAGFFGTLTLNTTSKAWTYTPTNFTAINALGEGKTATDTFDFSVADTNGATASQALTITYTGTNDLPVLVADIADQVFNGSGTWSYQIPANTFADAEGTALTYTVQVVANADGTGAVLDTITGVTGGTANLPSNWLKFDAASRTFSGTPTDTAPLPLYIKVTASDGTASVEDTFTVTLNAPASGANPTPGNLAPTTTDDYLATMGSAAVTLTVNDFGTYSDANGDALAAVKIVSPPSGVNGSLTYSTDGSSWNAVTANLEISKANIDLGYLKFTPGTSPAAITFQVGDGTAFSGTQTLTVGVGNAAGTVNMDASTVTTAKASEWTSVYSGNTSVLENYTGTVRVVVEATGGTVKLADATGVTAITQGYAASLTDGGTSIAFEGDLGQVNAALQQLQANLATNPNMTLTVSAIKGGSAYNPQNGHYYEVVTAGASWDAANAAAATKTFNGLKGYLATITSAEENAFILSKLPSTSWIGANDAATEGTWTWISGPEAGTTIYTGGATAPGQYTNWNSDEPSNSLQGALRENYAAFFAAGAEAGKWNDVKETDAFAYIVEYSDGFAGGTVLEQASRTITLNKAPASSAPVLAIAGDANYTENAAHKALNPALALTDLDSTTLASATVTIGAGKVAGDALALTNVPGTMGNIAGVYVDGVLTLSSSSNSATLAQWTAALKAVTFASTSDTPGASRTLSWQVTDPDGNASTVGTTSIAVTEVNDAPVAVNVADVTVGAGQAVSLDIGNVFTDPENETVTYSAEYQLANGTWAPVPATAGTFWLTFNPTSHLFSGNPPAGLPFLNLRVNGTDTSNAVGSTTFKLNLADATSGAAAANTLGTVSISGSTTLGATLTATAPTDADGLTGAAAYQWQMLVGGTLNAGTWSGGTWTDIGGATASTFVITQAQSNKSVRVQALYNDNGGFAEAPLSNALTVPALNVAGVVAVLGVTTPDEVLVASLSDANGIVGVTPTYQWYQGASVGALTTPISGATGSSYTLTLADGGKYVSVKVTYTDNETTAEAVSGGTTAPITLGAYPPVAVNDAGAATEAGGVANGSGGTGGSNAAGNVLTNDTDQNTAEVLTVAGVRAGDSEGFGEAGVLAGGSYTIAGIYGTLVIDATTGAYTYTVNQTAANVQALIGGEVVTDVFNYTVKDPTNKTDTGLLTITLTGADDTLLVENLPANFAVNEDQKMALVIPSNLSLVDPDFVGNATITLVASAGTLSGTTGQDVTVTGTDTGTLTLVGTLANISTWLTTAGNVQYTSAANANGATAATVTLNLGALVLGTTNVNITAVNDAPTSADKTVTFLEDGTHTFALADFAFADAADTASGTVNTLQAVKITTLPFYGSLKLNNVAVNQGDLVTVADITSSKLKFVPVADQNRDGYTSFTFQVQDNGGTDADKGDVNLSVTPNTFTFNVTPVNDAPVLTNGSTSTIVLATITEDNNTSATADGTNPGSLISTLVRTADGTSPTDTTKSVVTDVDFLSKGSTGGNANEGLDGGVAIYGLTNTGPADDGKWQFKLASGSWADVGAVSATNALLLSSADSIRFLPDGENATTATFSYYIWDGLVGTATAQQGTYASVATRDGSTNYSIDGDEASIVVTHVNDAPTLDLGGSATAGNDFTTTFLPRGGDVAVVATGAAGITISDVDQTSRTDVAQQDRISKAVVTITGGDDDNYPSLTNETLTFKDAGTTTTVWNGLSISGNGGTTVTITGVSTWANYQDALQKVVYNNANLTPTTGNRTITVVVTDNDDTDAANAHTNKLPSATATTTLNVASVAVMDLNGNLTGADNTVTYTEGDVGQALAAYDGRIDNLGNTFIKTVVFTLSNPLDGTAGDAESLFVDATAITAKITPRGITVTQSADKHTITLKASNESVGVSANDMNVALRLVQYKNTSDAPNVTARVVNVAVEDILKAGVSAKSTITIVPVNDAPAYVAGTAATVSEGGLVKLLTTHINATDIDDAQDTLDFVVTTAPTKGVLFRDANGNNQADTGEVLAATAGTGVITSFTQGDLVAGLVKYQQTDTLANSVTDYGSDSFAFKVQDGMENAVVAPTGTLAITITPVNDAPTLTATAGPVTFIESTGAAVALFSGSAISAVESAQTIGEIKLTVAGLADGAAEKLVIDGVTVALTNANSGTTSSNSFGYSVAVSGTTATVTLTKTDTAANWQTLVDALAYKNTSAAPSTNNRTVTLTSVKDSGGTSSGGVDTTALSLASTVSITDSDSAPVLAKNTGDNLANGGLTTLTATKLSTTDSDTANAALVYTVGTAPTKGTLFKDLNGSGAAETGEALTANSTFTQADIAAGLIKYRHGGADNTADNFTFTVKDATTTLSSASFAFTFSAAGTVAGSGSTTANSTDGTDALFSGVGITPTPDHTIKTLTFAVTGVKDGNKEVLSVNGQSIPMVAGTTTVGDVVYVVTETPANSGNFTVAVTDSTAPGFSGADASAITNGVRYSNTAVPPTPGNRSVALDSFTEMDSAGNASAPTDTNLVATTAVAPAVDLFALGAAQTAIVAPTAPNDVIQTLTFAVGGVVDGANEVFKINGVEVPLVPGATTVDGVTYTVAGTAPNLTVSVYKPAGFTEAAAEALVGGATLSNTASPASAGTRTVNLESVTEADSDALVGGVPTPTATPTTVTGLSTSTSTATSGTTVSPLPNATIPTIAGGSTIDSLTFTVSGVKDGANEVLAIGGTDVPLVPGTYPSASGATTAGSFTVAVDANGKATVVFTPDTNLSEGEANTLIGGVNYTNSATPATAGARDVALSNMGVDNGSTVTATPVTTITSAPIVLTGVTVPTLTPGAGNDLFDAIDLPQVAPGSSVKAITLGITGVQDGAKETITINGQKIPLVNGTSVTVNGVTYVVALDASGNGTLTVTDTAAPGWNEAQAENILNNIGYQNTANPPTPGDRAIKVNEVAQADNANWATPVALTLPTGATTPNTVAVTAPATTTPAGGMTDQLFDAVNLPTPTAGSTVSELTFTVSNVKDGSKEIFTVNGQNIPLAAGTTTVDGVVYTVTVDANGTATVKVTDSTVPGFTQAKAEAIVNGAAYTNTASPASAGDRVVTLTGAKEMTAAGVQTDMTGLPTVTDTVAVAGTTPTSPSGTVAVGLFTADQAAAAIPTPTAGNDIQTLTFAVNGVKDGVNEVLQINGQSIPMVAGETVVGDVTYKLVEAPAGSGNFTVTVTDATAPAFSETQAEAMVSGATLSNTTATPTAGNRTVSLTSVTEALNTAPGTASAPTTITGATATVSSSGTGTVNTPMAGETLPVTAGTSSVDSLTFTVTGVKDGANEVLAIGGTNVPLVPGTYLSATGATTPGSYTVAVDANGKATVVFTPTTNLTDAQAKALVQATTYTNSATPPSAGAREVALSSMVQQVGDGTTAGTTNTVTPSGIGSTIAVNGAPSTDVFASSVVIPTVPGGSTVDQISFGVSGVKDGANEVVQINGQSIPLVPGTTTDANGNTYTVVVDANGNATVTMATPAPAATNLTEAQANAILNGVSYTNKASPITAGARDITVNSVVTEDGSGTTTTVPTPGLSSTVPLGNVTNTAPQITVNIGITVAEGQTFTLSPTQLAATDAQTDAGNLVFKLAAAPAHGTLFRDSNGNGLAEATEVIAANGSFTQAELTSGKIKYRHDSSETAADQLSLTVSDGLATTTAVPFVMTVTAVNDAPTITATATAANSTFTEATTPVPVVLFTAATATTGDTLGAAQKLTSLTLTVSNVVDGNKEMLLVNGVNTIELSGTTASGTVGQVNSTNLTYTVSKSGNTTTVTLNHAGMTEIELKALVESFKYQNTSADPTAGARAVNITQLKDNGGGTLPNLDTAYLSLGSTVTVSATNDAPTLTGAGFTVVEGGSFVLSATQLAALDADTPLANLVYAVSTAPTAGLLYIDNNGNAVNDSGDTTLALNSTFTHAQLTSGKVRYQHDGSESADPLLAFSVSDGNTSSVAKTVAVALTSVNDAPTLAGLDGDVLTYPPANAAMLIDVGGNATVTDPDSTDFAGGVLRASIYFNGNASKDVLSIKNVGTGTGQIGVSAANVSYANTVIGTVAGGSSGADLVVTLNASADKAATEALIHALQFYNSETAPTVNSRGIRISLSDGDGATSLASQVQVNIPVGGPTFLSGSGFYVSENTSLVTVMAATESDTAKLPIVYSISTAVGGTNVDAAKFSIDASNGTLSFIAAPDFEAPADSGGNNVYNVVVRASNKELAYTEAALAVNVVNVVNESGPAPGDTTPPQFALATVNGSTLVMTYTDASNNLDATNVPPTTAFAVSGNTVTAVAVNATAKTVTLTLGTAVLNGAAVTVAYTDPTTGNDVAALQDAAGNDAITLVATAVSNLTPSTGGGGSSGGGSTGGGSTGGGSTGGGSTGGGTTVTNPDGGSTTTNTTTLPGGGTSTTTTTTQPGGGSTTSTTTVTGDTSVRVTTATNGGISVRETETNNANGTTTILTNVPPFTGNGNTSGTASVSLVSENGGATGGGESTLTARLPVGVGLTSEATSSAGQTLRQQLISASNPRVSNDPAFRDIVDQGIDRYVAEVADESQVTVRTITLNMPTGQTTLPTSPIVINGANGTGEDNLTHPLRQEALIIDARSMPPGTVLQLDKVEFAIVIGAVRLVGGDGRNFVVGDDADQFMVLGAEDDMLRGGNGNDVVASRGGSDQLYGDGGNDWLVGGVGDDLLFGGTGNDLLHGGASDAGTFRFSLNANGQVRADYTAKHVEMAAISSGTIDGQWRGADGGLTISDPRFAFVGGDGQTLQDVALIYQLLVKQLPTVTELSHWAGSGLNPSQFGQLAYDFYVAQQGGATPQALEIQMASLIEFVWGGTADAELVKAGVDYLTNGGQWGEALLYLARHESNHHSIKDAGGRLKLTQDMVLSETGWSGGGGNDQLFGGAGNDVLVAGSGNNLLDGGSGVDLAVLFGQVDDWRVAVNEQAQVVLTQRHTGEKNIIADIELLQIGDIIFCQGKANAPVVVTGVSYRVTDFLTSANDEQIGMIGVPGWSVI